MGGYPEVWRQHFTSEGAARNNVGPAEKTTESVSLRNGLREMLRVTGPKQLPKEGSTPYKLGRLRRSPWTSAHSIPADVAWREPQSPWEASAEHSFNQPATYQWSKTEESSGCGVQLRLKEELGVAFTTST